ncbi:hypothetical protein FJY90_04365 [Candidatus Gottesmanbacteria bacterium]|nr:hypothetical protein [Candidatus Gottesmanbacteria bacterium]
MNRLSLRTKNIQVALTVFLFASVFLALVAAGMRYVRPKAAGGPISLSFTSLPEQLRSGGDFDLIVRANPGDLPFNAFELHFTFDDTKAELRNLSDPGSNIERMFSSDLSLTQKIEGNKIVISGAKTGDAFSGNQNIDLVKVKMKLKADAVGTVKFVWDAATQLERKAITTNDGVFVLKGAKLYFGSVQTNYLLGENLDLKLNLDTAGAAVNAVQFEFAYDDKFITFQNSTSDLAANNIEISPNSGFEANNALKNIDTQNKIIRIGLVNTTASVTGDKHLATVKLKIKEDAPYGQVAFVANDNSKVYSSAETKNVLSEKPSYSITIGEIVTSITPTRVLTPSPTYILSPTSTPSPKETNIPIGKKDSLSVVIGQGRAAPNIRFAVKLAHVQNTPDMYMRLRVKDELAFQDIILGQSVDDQQNPEPEDTCQSPGFDEMEFWVPMRADGNKVYRPLAKISADLPAGKTPAVVSPDGWVTLVGVKTGRYSSIFIKAPKTRKTIMAQHILLENGFPASQDFSWTDNPLAPGDLFDPNNSLQQDCVVNSVDISLFSPRLASCCNKSCNRSYDSSCPDWEKMTVADVNYDGAVDGNDISKVVDTLSTKPDDD